MKLFLEAANKPKKPPRILAEADLTKLVDSMRPHWHTSTKAAVFTVAGAIRELSLNGEYEFSIVLTAADLLGLLSVAIGPQDPPPRTHRFQGPHICAAGAEPMPIVTLARASNGK